jgi:hypothetical protein
MGTQHDPRGLVEHLAYHVQTLPEIHARYVEEFTLQPGFGADRCHFGPAVWIELILPSGGPSPSEAPEAQGRFTPALRPGYHEGLLVLRTAAGLVWLRPRERVWRSESEELIGLRPGEPAGVRQRRHPSTADTSAGYLPRRRAEAGRPPTSADTPRPLSDFEENAVESLRQGAEFVVDTTAERMCAVGAIRARDACLRCHAVAEGELLGALTYRLTLVGETDGCGEDLIRGR